MSSAAQPMQPNDMHMLQINVYNYIAVNNTPDCNLLKVNRVITTQNFGRNLEETLLEKYNKHKI